ncbi:AAA family ATPase [Flavobacterium solisilvae]|uniref:AAA family ATPase n=1 Tax=Flavobacterium solisilvae TaxID=1852019 RepID=A0ABX1QS67_9FLAO|nr:AAA family ATPase [Flavobacterium solisilvae]NMH25127.1 AAA family ATPase [Flavobacterium solisilvae]
MQHLILTGKNGSGKTSVLNEIKKFVNLFLKNEFPDEVSNSLDSIINNIEKIESENIYITSEKIKVELQDEDKTFFRDKIDELFVVLGRTSNLMLSTNTTFKSFKNEFENGNYIFTSFSAKRNFKTNEVKSPQKIDLPDIFETDQHGNELFLQYLVNQQVQLLYAKADKDAKTVKEIEDWFKKIRSIFRDIFEDETLDLIYDRDNYVFKFKTLNREEFEFNTLSDGFSSILGIIAEIIMRMERKSSKIYKLNGLILIDELETHLHISLQRKVLRILTTLFPNLQFIVTTHSPFILNSIENAVVYDMEYQETIHDVSKYSTEALVENYFESNKYSEALLEKINHYEKLLKKRSNSDEEIDEIIEMKKYFDDLPLINSKEMELKINLLNLDYKDKFERLIQHD